MGNLDKLLIDQNNKNIIISERKRCFIKKKYML